MSQIIFITFETTGWLPNYREIDGTLFGRITEWSVYTYLDRKIKVTYT
ncbi:YfzA family protein [Bacillus badius]|nr:YfzA family protein [Bacillus badius]MED4718371.1 YfzA family protein [Bacillus badius]